MRLATCLLLPGMVGGVGAASPSASFFSFENPASIPSPQTVSPEVARLILARRLGLSRFHRLGGLDDGSLRQVDDLGGRQERLLSNSNYAQGPSMVIVVEGVGDPGDIIPSTKMSPSFFILDPPTSSANRILLNDFVSQARFDHSLDDNLDFTTRDDILMGSFTLDQNTPVAVLNDCRARFTDTFEEANSPQVGHREVDEVHIFDALTSFRCGNAKAMIHFDLLEVLARREGASSTVYRDATTAIKTILLRLADMPMENNQKISVILMPINSRNAKRSDQPYGSYSSPIDRSTASRQRGPEVPLSDMSRSPRESPLKASKGFRGPIPVCHSSLNECNSATRNCSGRGTCAIKHPSGNSSSADSQRACFACLNCKPDVKHSSGGGTKTTYWGGAACHKQDVSIPFLILVIFTILMVGAVTWGIGLLYSIGQEDLPGVLSAGVAAKAR